MVSNGYFSFYLYLVDGKSGIYLGLSWSNYLFFHWISCKFAHHLENSCFNWGNDKIIDPGHFKSKPVCRIGFLPIRSFLVNRKERIIAYLWWYSHLAAWTWRVHYQEYLKSIPNVFLQWLIPKYQQRIVKCGVTLP